MRLFCCVDIKKEKKGQEIEMFLQEEEKISEILKVVFQQLEHLLAVDT